MPYSTGKSSDESIHKYHEQLRKTDIDFISELSSNIKFKDIIENHIPEYRDRLYPPLVTLRLFLQQVLDADKTCKQTVFQYQSECIAKSKPIPSGNTAAYCKARHRIPTDLISNLAKYLGDSLYSSAKEALRWYGRSVKLVDGSTVSMPDTPENQKAYPQNSEQKAGLGYPIARILSINCLSTGAILDLNIGTYKSSEHSLLREKLDDFSKNDVLLGDRYYCSYFLLANLYERGIDAVFKMNARRKYDFREGTRLGKGDHIVSWKKPQRPTWMDKCIYDEMPNEITLREIKKNDTVIVSTLLNREDYPKNAIFKLYRDRWHIELDLRAIKQVMGMDILRCKCPDLILKEIWVFILAYNYIRNIMYLSTQNTKKEPRMLSFKTALNATRVLTSSFTALPKSKKIEIYHHIYFIIGQSLVGNRPDRIEPRAVKRRMKKSQLLMEPRHIARQRLKKSYGLS